MTDPQNIPYGYCHCGCGQKTNLIPDTAKYRIVERGKPRKYVNGHSTRRPPSVRFWEKVDKNGPNGCWAWTGALRNGYGHFGVSAGEFVYAHRYSYEQLVGPVPSGLHIDHLCRNRACCNPAHLEPVTQTENNRRAERVRDSAGRFL